MIDDRVHRFCIHITRDDYPVASTIEHNCNGAVIAAPYGPFNHTTELCALCTGYAKAALARLATEGVPP